MKPRKEQDSQEQAFERMDFSGGPQQASTVFLKKPNEIDYVENADFGVVGGVKKSLGYTKRSSDLTSTTSTSTSSSTTTTSTSTSSSTSTSTSTTTTAESDWYN
jgi:hypothetical protein